MFNRYFLLILVAVLPLSSFSQALKTGAEQDCINALPICDSVFTQTDTYRGWGLNRNEVPGSSCLQNKENNSVWYIFTTSQAGTLQFLITPLSSNDDYDFALYDLTGHSCSDIPTGVAPEVRCNYAVSTGAATGIAPGGVGTSSSANGNPVNLPLVVGANQTFALLIDNFNGRSTQGYTIDFRHSTTNVADTVKPKMVATDTTTCDTSTLLTVHFSKPLLCSSIASNGSDFTVTGPSTVTVVGAFDTACTNGKFTTEVKIRLAAPIIVGGIYNINLKTGTDGNTVLDFCGHVADPASIAFTQKGLIFPNFTDTFAPACLIDTIKFTNTTLPIGAATSFLWDFGDGATSTDPNPFHIFPAVGTYQVKLSALTADCQKDTTITVTVGRNFKATFSWVPISPCTNQQIQFTDSVPGNSFLYAYDFGNGAVAGTHNPTYAYPDSGIYNIKFKIVSTVGICSDSVTQSITVKPLVHAAFGINPTAVCQGVPITFTDSSSGEPTSWLWNFGTNGFNTSAQQNISYTYDSVGTFTVKLNATNGCNTDSVSRNVTVKTVPSFSLGADTTICKPDSVLLTVSANVDSIIWSTGDTISSIYVKDVPQDVHVRVVKDGCSFETSRNIDEKQDGCIAVHLPTAFSPNGDGENDWFRLVNPERIQSLDIKIFNRWGEQVFHDTKVDFKWNGTINGDKAPEEVYTWFMLVTGLSGQNEFYKGNLTIVK